MRPLPRVYPASPHPHSKKITVSTPAQPQVINVKQQCEVRQRPSLPDVRLIPANSPRKLLPNTTKSQDVKRKSPTKFTVSTRLLLKKHLKEQQPVTNIEFEEENSPSAFIKAPQQYRLKEKPAHCESTYKLIVPKPAYVHNVTQSDPGRGIDGVVSLLKEAAAVKYELQYRSGMRQVNGFLPSLKGSGETTPIPTAVGSFATAAAKEQAGYRIRSLLNLPNGNSEPVANPPAQTRVRVWKGRLGTLVAK